MCVKVCKTGRTVSTHDQWKSLQLLAYECLNTQQYIRISESEALHVELEI